MTSTTRTLTTVGIFFVLVVIGVVAYFWVTKWHRDQMAESRRQAQKDCMEMIQQMEADMEKLRAQAAADPEAQAAEAVVPTVFGTPTPGYTAPDQPADCDRLDTQLRAFFDHVDAQPYMAGGRIDGGSAAFVRDIVHLLLDHPPVNIAELQELSRLVKNVTHFYRVLGKDRLILAKEMLLTEEKILEPTLALFFAHVVRCGRPLPGDAKALSIERIYDYAGFFLNTLGGRSYLLRRESKIRMLVSYYAILVIDLANDEKFNRYGIDVRPYIDFLFYDISHQKGLTYRERYLTRLTALRDKYM